jgi:FAD/FMN-containing dehydrogenase
MYLLEPQLVQGKEHPDTVTQLTGRVLHRGDPGWEEARLGFAQWAEYDAHEPRVIVFCQDAQDVSHAVRWARENKVSLRSRSGRHSYEAYSSLVKDGIIIDVSELDSVRASRDGPEVVVGAGIDMLDFFEALGEVGLTVPGATGPTVGLAGLVLGGGFGITSRLWGLTCDSLTDIELVNAQGEITHANARQNPDLFWACRGGGGGNFGIATAFTFTAHPIANVAIFNISWSWDLFEAVVEQWQRWSPAAEDRLTATLMLTATGTIAMYGQFTAADADLPRIYTLLEPMLAPTPPLSVSIQIAPNVPATRTILGVDPMNPQWRVHKHSDEQIFKSTSAFAFDPFPEAAIQLLKRSLEQVPKLECAPSQPSMVQLLPGGGYPSRIKPDATAIYARHARFIVQYDAYWTAPVDGARTIAWVEALRTSMQPYTRGAYVNYVDDRIKDWLQEYYGPNLPRLVAAKKKYDPEDLFRFPQSIPTTLPQPSA